MYTEDELLKLQQQAKKMKLVPAVIGIVFLIAILVSFILRIQVLTVLLTIFCGSFIIFYAEMYLKPILAYRTHVDAMLHGRIHTTEGTFQHISAEIDLVEGVRYHAVSILEPSEKEPIERLFYYDLLKEFPELTPGTPVRIVYHDREIAAMEIMH